MCHRFSPDSLRAGEACDYHLYRASSLLHDLEMHVGPNFYQDYFRPKQLSVCEKVMMPRSCWKLIIAVYTLLFLVNLIYSCPHVLAESDRKGSMCPSVSATDYQLNRYHWKGNFDNFQCSQWCKFRQNDNILSNWHHFGDIGDYYVSMPYISALGTQALVQTMSDRQAPSSMTMYFYHMHHISSGWWRNVLYIPSNL